jgi:hypothetical protein
MLKSTREKWDDIEGNKNMLYSGIFFLEDNGTVS